MQFYEIYNQSDEAETQSLVEMQPYAYLLTLDTLNVQKIGVFNPILKGKNFFLHLNRKDEQIDSLRGGRAMLVFHDFLALIPSHWSDANYAGAATMYYRYAEFECTVELLDSPEEMKAALQLTMDHYQPEGKYEALEPSSSTYAASFRALVIVRLSIQSVRSKWKLGQNKSVEQRLQVVEHLRQRNQGHDLRAADEILKSLKLKR